MNRPRGHLEPYIAAARTGRKNPDGLFPSRGMGSGSLRLPEMAWTDHFSLLEPQISTEGVHVWPFDISCPVDVVLIKGDGRNHVRMNRHGYFEVLYLCSGSAACRVEDRVLAFNEGDMAILGGGVSHSIECHSSRVTLAALFFEPDFIRFDGSDSSEYLTPFLLQGSTFPHIVPAQTGVPEQVLSMMLRIRSELPAHSPRARLALSTYLKMLLILIVNHYASYVETVESFQDEQGALERLLPLFRFLAQNCSSSIDVRKAARLCGMRESYLMSFFRQVTGLKFMEYLNRHRIGRAQALLLNTDEPIASISQEVGYCDQSYFGVVFRKVTGMTPANYRRRYKVGRSLSGLHSPLGSLDT